MGEGEAGENSRRSLTSEGQESGSLREMRSVNETLCVGVGCVGGCALVLEMLSRVMLEE